MGNLGRVDLGTKNRGVFLYKLIYRYLFFIYVVGNCIFKNLEWKQKYQCFILVFFDAFEDDVGLY